MKTKIREQTLWLFALLGAILCMGVGYASINSITGEITGNLVAKVQGGVFITNVECVSSVDANLDKSEIKKYVGTLMQSTVELSNTNPNSEITYKVTVYNNSLNRYPFLAVKYDEEFYNNPNIIFEISRFVVGDIIEAKEKKEIFITFKYKDGVIPQDKNTVLNSYIDFKIAEPRRLMVTADSGSTASYLRGTVTKDKIESIDFVISKEPPTDIIESFDASEKKDGSIIGYYTNSGTEGLYKLTFVSDEIMVANKNAECLFQNLTNLKEISFNNFSTFAVTNMIRMFYGCSGLTELNLSDFDTSQVTAFGSVFGGIFQGCASLESIDLSNWNTSQVKTFNCMFKGCKKLNNLNLSSFDTSLVTNMRAMFSGCSVLTELDISNFDTSQVEVMIEMFNECIGLTQLNLKNFNTSKVINMQDMFRVCSGLTELDLSNFDTTQVAFMGGMFQECSGLTELDLSSFNTCNVTDMFYTFNSCRNLKKIYVKKFNAETNTGWTTSKVTNSTMMFYRCTSIVGGNGTTYNSNNINATFAVVDSEKTKGYLTDVATKP